MKIYKSVDELIGKTPLLEVSKFAAVKGVDCRILCKLEYLNPAGSIKDRAALYMINDAERKGLIKKGSTIIEPTSGNTGIGLAAIGASRGYRVILTMPESMSIERRKLLTAYGAEIVLTDAAGGMAAAIKKAQELSAQTENSFIPSQFENPANSEAHYKTTAKEIWDDTEGKFDIFVSAVGTGGTISGCARYFKEKSSDINVVAVEPDASPLISKGHAGPHGIQGIGANFIPDLYERELVDSVVTVKDEEAYDAARTLAKSEGILVGISSGAALAAALKLSAQDGNKGKTIVVILPDTGDRYLSTKLFG